MKKEDNTFEFLIEYISAKLTEWIMQEEGLDLENALLNLHNSDTFDKLCDRKTALYIESPAFVYDLYKEEMKKGTLKGMSE